MTSVDPPKSLEFTDGFAERGLEPRTAEMPTTDGAGCSSPSTTGGTRMELRSVFGSREQMEQLAEMGMVEGLKQAVGQMDALLAA